MMFKTYDVALREINSTYNTTIIPYYNECIMQYAFLTINVPVVYIYSGQYDKLTGHKLCQRSCGAMDNASYYESEDCRFESYQDRQGFMWQGFKQATMAS